MTIAYKAVAHAVVFPGCLGAEDPGACIVLSIRRSVVLWMVATLFFGWVGFILFGVFGTVLTFLLGMAWHHNDEPPNEIFLEYKAWEVLCK